MKFRHCGNVRAGFVVPIPRAKNYQTFEKNEWKERWLDKILKHLNNIVKIPQLMIYVDGY